MRKLIAIVFIIIACGGYSYYWFKKAGDFKAVVEQSIAQENTLAKQYNKDITLLRYESIAMSGYPFSMQVNIIKPVIDLPVSAMMLDFAQKDNKTIPANKPNVVFEVSFNGAISLASNMEVNEFSLVIPGESTVKPIVNNDARKAITDTSSPIVCHLGINNPDNMPWNVPQSFTDTNAFLTAFRSADCSVSGKSSKYVESGDMLSSADNFSITASSTPMDEENRKIALSIEAKNAKVFPAFDEFLNSYVSMLYEVVDTQQDIHKSEMNLSQYGEQNAKIDISYEGPIDQKQILDPSVNINFDVGAFNLKNDLYETNNRIHFSTAVHGNERESALTMNSSLEASEKYEQLLAQGLTTILAEIAKSPAPEIKFSSEIAALSNPGDLAAAIVPKFGKVGKINFDADISVSNDKDKSIVDAGDITINALNLTTNQYQYGLKLKGSGKNTGGTMPVGELLATCVLCDDTLNNIGEYAMNIDSVLATTRTGQTHYITKPLVEGIKQFLHAIDENAADKTSKNILIHFVANDKGMITISGKQLLEVIGLFGVNVGQNLQRAGQEEATQPKVNSPPTPAK